MARALAAALGASLVEHARFLTATVGSATRRDGSTSRPRAASATRAAARLPRVMPASIEQDLRRRDFTVNAMAVELGSGAFELLDPHGGRVDLEARRLRILHPASFVEDPTRMFRAARYAARLGLRPDAWTTRCQAWALSLAPYPALSGARILAELAAHPRRRARPSVRSCSSARPERIGCSIRAIGSAATHARRGRRRAGDAGVGARARTRRGAASSCCWSRCSRIRSRTSCTAALRRLEHLGRAARAHRARDRRAAERSPTR